MLHRRALLFAGLLLGTAVAAVAARPAFADQGDISVGGVWITRITHSWAGVSAADRATEVTRRITEVLSTPEFRQGAVVSVRPEGADALVMVGNMLVFTVTAADATGTSNKPLQVAKYWASLLGQGLTRALPGSTFYF
ncbi:MAG TPA: hypothetical protein VKW09_10355 [bacterium]|nr:hypothetical protein [bacterium]